MVIRYKIYNYVSYNDNQIVNSYSYMVRTLRRDKITLYTYQGLKLKIEP